MTQTQCSSTADYLIERSQPAPSLEPFIDNFQLLTLPQGGALPRVLPGTGALCIMPMDSALTVTDLHEGRPHTLAEPFVVCNRHQVLDFSAPGPARFLVVSFRPGRLRYFTTTSFAQLQDRISPATQLWGDSVLELAARIKASTYSSECMAQISAFLVNLLSEKRETRLDLLMDMLYLSPATRISDIAGEAGWSLRHFERLFTGTYGVSPKFFARVARLQRVARKLALDPVTSLSGSALDAGFFDQSHFVHELRRLAGLSPAELAHGVRDRPHFYNPKSLHGYIAMLRTHRNTTPEAATSGTGDAADGHDVLSTYRARTLAHAERLIQS